MTRRDPIIVAARRSPIATRGRGLAGLTVEQLAAPVLRATLRDALRTVGGDHAVADVILDRLVALRAAKPKSGRSDKPSRLRAVR